MAPTDVPAPAPSFDDGKPHSRNQLLYSARLWRLRSGSCEYVLRDPHMLISELQEWSR